MTLTIDNSSEIQINLFKIAETALESVAPDLIGWDRFNKRFDIFMFLMRDPDWATKATNDEIVNGYNDFFGSQYDGQVW